MFTSKLYCANCDSRMHGHQGPNGKPSSIFYTCSGGKQKGPGKCRCRRVNEREVLRTAIDLIYANILTPFKAGDWSAALEARLRERIVVNPTEIKRLRGELTAIDKRIATGTERYLTAPAHLVSDIAAKLEAWKGEREALVKQVEELEQARKQAPDIKRVVRSIVNTVENIDVYLLVNPDREAKRNVLSRIIERVDVSFEDREEGERLRSVVTGIDVAVYPDAFSVKNLATEMSSLVDRS